MGRRVQAATIERRAFTLGLMTAAALPSIAKAQSFPTKAIQIIVPNAAGGVNDVLARIIAQKLQDQLGKPVVVENRPGAGGDIGTEGVLKAEPDGHTLVMGSIQLTLGNGRSQPPQNRVTATEETTKILAYSARK